MTESIKHWVEFYMEWSNASKQCVGKEGNGKEEQKAMKEQDCRELTEVG